MTGAPLTPDELRDLRLVRARAMMDRGDVAPMMLVTSRPDAAYGPSAEAEVIPWLDALNLDVTP